MIELIIVIAIAIFAILCAMIETIKIEKGE